jgi:hypothetical protein
VSRPGAGTSEGCLLSRTTRRLTVALVAAALAAIAALPAGSPAGTGRLSRPPRQFQLVAYETPVMPSQWHNHALSAAAARAERRLARERARRRRERARREREERVAAERARAASSATVGEVADGGSPQEIAAAMLGDYGWGQGQFGCLVSLWNAESGWNVHAFNQGSGAYGIPQSLPGSKMSSAGPDWMNDAATQIRWGLGYIRARYGSPCAAWDQELRAGWY